MNFKILQIDQKTRDEIKQIRELVREKELKWQKRKEKKDRENLAKQSARNDDQQEMRPRSGSYTLLAPTFSRSLLPKISIETSDSDKETVVDASIQSFTTENDESAENKSTKDLRNEIDKRSTTQASVFESSLAPSINNHLKELIEKQKQEYLRAMEALKNKFSNEQHDLMMNIQTNLLVSSTPLNSSVAPYSSTDDEDFTEFKTGLRSQSISLEDKTIINDHDAKVSYIAFPSSKKIMFFSFCFRCELQLLSTLMFAVS